MIRVEQNIYEGKIYVKKLNCTHKELMEMLTLTSAVVKDGLIIIRIAIHIPVLSQRSREDLF